MQPRRIIWLVAALLSLVSLQGAVAVRVESRTEIRSCICLLLEARSPRSVARVRPQTVGRVKASLALPRPQVFNSSFEEARPRLQLPPPFLA